MPPFLWECNRRNEGPCQFVSGFFTFFLIVTNGDPLELTTDVKYLFIGGQLTSLDNRHLRLYEKYSKRPKPQ